MPRNQRLRSSATAFNGQQCLTFNKHGPSTQAKKTLTIEVQRQTDQSHAWQRLNEIRLTGHLRASTSPHGPPNPQARPERTPNRDATRNSDRTPTGRICNGKNKPAPWARRHTGHTGMTLCCCCTADGRTSKARAGPQDHNPSRLSP